MFEIVFLTLVTGALADHSSISQGHIKYSDVSGAQVHWKSYAPYSQSESVSQNHRRRDSAELMPEESATVESAIENPGNVVTDNSSPRYRPLSQAPSHLKQLLTRSYEAQTPYVNPDAFLHRIPEELSFGEVIPRKSVTTEDRSRIQSAIARAQDYREGRQMSTETPQRTGGGNRLEMSRTKVPFVSGQQSLSSDKSVPLEIQRLLHYQAIIPYNVIANRILYSPVKPFVPEPLLEDEIGPYKYRSRVYYAVKNGMKGEVNGQEDPVSKDRSTE